MTRGREPDRAYWLTANLAALASGLAAKMGHRPFPGETAQRTEITAWITELAAKIAAGLEDRDRLDWLSRWGISIHDKNDEPTAVVQSAHPRAFRALLDIERAADTSTERSGREANDLQDNSNQEA
jgi:hypothetical protein